MDEFLEKYKDGFTKNYITYGEFMYQATSQDFPMKVIFRIERSTEEMVLRATFIMTTLTAPPETVVRAYNKRGTMENYIKVSTVDFGMVNVSHSSFMSNAIKSTIKSLANNIKINVY